MDKLAVEFEELYGIGRDSHAMEYQQWLKNRINHTKTNWEARLAGKFQVVDRAPNYYTLKKQESKEKMGRAMSYISSLDKNIFDNTNKNRYDNKQIGERAREIRKIKDTFDLDYVELREALNRALPYHFAQASVRYIYLYSGRNPCGRPKTKKVV